MEGNAWWNQSGMIFYNNQYNPEPEALENLKSAQVIGVLFGSYSSRSTRIFTKFVRKFHAEIRARTDAFQIIFCSMDDNEKDCQDFVKALHGDWLVVPWWDQVNRRGVRNQCNVSSHLALVILKNEADGIVISVDGKDELLDLGEAALERWEGLASGVVKKSLETD